MDEIEQIVEEFSKTLDNELHTIDEQQRKIIEIYNKQANFYSGERIVDSLI